jgi:bacillithiol system protein YtxJ
MNTLNTRADLDALFDRPVALLYKHSMTCPISRAAHKEVDALLAAQPDAPVYMIDVNRSRDLSDRVAEVTGLRHESPQAIVLRDGQPAWHAAHFSITRAALATALDAAP